MKAWVIPGQSENIDVFFEDGTSGYIPSQIVANVLLSKELKDIPVYEHYTKQHTEQIIEIDGHILQGFTVSSNTVTDEGLQLFGFAPTT